MFGIKLEYENNIINQKQLKIWHNSVNEKTATAGT